MIKVDRYPAVVIPQMIVRNASKETEQQKRRDARYVHRNNAPSNYGNWPAD